MNFDQFKRAIIAKTKDKTNMPDFYYKRLEKCIGCEFNSGNNEKLSFVDRIRVSHNFGKDACLKCTCGVEDKASDPVESCPEGFWKQEEGVKHSKLKITTESEKVNLEFNKGREVYFIDYGTIKYQFDSRIMLSINRNNITDFTTKTSCGCTAANITYTDTNIELAVSYDTKRIGSFQKNITMTYKDKGEIKQTLVIIKGTVNKK